MEHSYKNAMGRVGRTWYRKAHGYIDERKTVPGIIEVDAHSKCKIEKKYVFVEKLSEVCKPDYILRLNTCACHKTQETECEAHT